MKIKVKLPSYWPSSTAMIGSPIMNDDQTDIIGHITDVDEEYWYGVIYDDDYLVIDDPSLATVEIIKE